MSELWIDTDMGSDDVFAIVAAHAHRQIDGVSLVSGNVPLPQVSSNAHRCAAAFGWGFPFHVGADRPVLGPPETAQYVLGLEGLPVRGEGPLLDDVDETSLPGFLGPLCDWLDRDDGPRDILALGPLTNLAILALARPDLMARIGRLVWMGGAVGRGNHTPSAEFNAFSDPEAAQIVLARGATPEIIDLDACRKVLIDEEDVSAQARNTSPRGILLTRLLGGYLDIALTRKRSAMALYDPVAAAAMIAPEYFTLAPARTRMECAGTVTRGRTEVDFASGLPNSGYAVDLNADAIRALCLGALRDA